MEELQFRIAERYGSSGKVRYNEVLPKEDNVILLLLRVHVDVGVVVVADVEGAKTGCVE